MVGAPECQGLPARRAVVYELTSRTPIPAPDRFPVVATPDAPWAIGITDVKDAPVLEPGLYVVRGRIFGEARVHLLRVGTPISIEYDHYSNDGLLVLDGTESLSIEADSVPFTADIQVSGCRTGFLASNAALAGTSVTAVFAPPAWQRR